MQIKTLLVFILIAVLCENTTAQIINFGFDTGYGTYQMTENKKVLKNAMIFNELKPRCVSNFPGYIFFRPYVEVESQYINIGFAYTLMSTGSRYSIRDYSGEYKLDVQVLGNVFAAFAETPIYAAKSLTLLLAAESGIVINQLKMNESLQLQETYNHHDDYNFESRNIFLKPYLKAKYSLTSRIFAHMIVGYHKDLKSDNMNLENDGLRASAFVSDWDGIRTSIGISFQLR